MPLLSGSPHRLPSCEHLLWVLIGQGGSGAVRSLAVAQKIGAGGRRQEGDGEEIGPHEWGAGGALGQSSLHPLGARDSD